MSETKRTLNYLGGAPVFGSPKEQADDPMSPDFVPVPLRDPLEQMRWHAEQQRRTRQRNKVYWQER